MQSYDVSKTISTIFKKVNVIMGPLAKKYYNNYDNVEFYNSPSDYASMISKSPYLVTNGGNCLFEGLYLKKKNMCASSN